MDNVRGSIRITIGGILLFGVNGIMETDPTFPIWASVIAVLMGSISLYYGAKAYLESKLEEE
jgi:hypothetical protein